MRLERNFFARDVLKVAPDLLGKTLVRQFSDHRRIDCIITDVEAYRGEEDKACHASKGRTPRTEAMYGKPGILYVYLIYGIHWLLNVITGKMDEPQGILIRGLDLVSGAGRVGRLLEIDRSFYAEDTTTSERLWFEDHGEHVSQVRRSTRFGVEYAGKWAHKMWRFYLPEDSS